MLQDPGRQSIYHFWKSVPIFLQYTHTHTHTHRQTDRHTHTYTHARTHARTRARARARTHTHTHLVVGPQLISVYKDGLETDEPHRLFARG